MKKIIGFMVILLSLSYFSTSTASANENDKEGVSDLFKNFIENVYADVDEVTVLDAQNKDVTASFIAKTKSLYVNKDYKGIQNVIMNEELDISYDTYEYYQKLKKLDVQSPSQLATLVTEGKTTQFYHLKKETSLNRYTKEWLTSLSGSLTFNTSTQKTVSATTPTLRVVTANFGQTFSAHMDNISTKRTITGNSVKYSGTYKMNGTLSVPLGDFPIGFKLNFGTHTDSFTQAPSYLQ